MMCNDQIRASPQLFIGVALLFMTKHSLISWLCRVLFMHSRTDGHLDFLHLALMSSASVSIPVQALLSILLEGLLLCSRLLLFETGPHPVVQAGLKLTMQPQLALNEVLSFN